MAAEARRDAEEAIWMALPHLDRDEVVRAVDAIEQTPGLHLSVDGGPPAKRPTVQEVGQAMVEALFASSASGTTNIAPGDLEAMALAARNACIPTHPSASSDGPAAPTCTCPPPVDESPTAAMVKMACPVHGPVAAPATCDGSGEEEVPERTVHPDGHSCWGGRKRLMGNTEDGPRPYDAGPCPDCGGTASTEGGGS